MKKNNAINLNSKEVEVIKKSLYLYAIMDKTGGTEEDIMKIQGSSRSAFP